MFDALVETFVLALEVTQRFVQLVAALFGDLWLRLFLLFARAQLLPKGPKQDAFDNLERRLNSFFS